MTPDSAHLHYWARLLLPFLPPDRAALSSQLCLARYLGILGHLFLVRHFVDFQECLVPGATFKGIARPNPSADRRAKSNTDSPRRVGPVLDFATENKDPHFSTILGLQYIHLLRRQYGTKATENKFVHEIKHNLDMSQAA